MAWEWRVVESFAEFVNQLVDVMPSTSSGASNRPAGVADSCNGASLDPGSTTRRNLDA
jgi:hypothetical protein